MLQPEQVLSDSMRKLSRRTVLRMWTLATFAGAEADPVNASTETGGRREQIWKRSVDSELDPRVAILEEAGVTVAFSDLLAVDEGHLYAFDVETGARLWKRPIADPPMARIHGGLLYHHNGETLTALDPRSGEEQWTITGQFGHPSTYKGDYAVFSTEVGGATVVNLVDGTIPWEPEVRTMTDPMTLVDGELVLRGDREFIAYNVETGEQLWRFAGVPTGGLNTTVRASWPYCFITSVEPAETLALDLTEGTVRWHKERSIYPRIFVSGGPEGGIVLSTNIGTITGLNPLTGEERWSQSLTENSLFLYLIDDGLAVPVAEDHVWAVSLEDGSIQWEHSLDSSFPVVHESNDTFYAADTSIRAFDRDGSLTWKSDFTGDEALFPAVSGNHLVATSGSSVYGFAIEPEPEPEPTDTPGENPTATPTERTTATTSASRSMFGGYRHSSVFRL